MIIKVDTSLFHSLSIKPDGSVTAKLKNDTSAGEIYADGASTAVIPKNTEITIGVIALGDKDKSSVFLPDAEEYGSLKVAHKEAV